MVAIIIVFGIVYEIFLRKRFGKTRDAVESNVELRNWGMFLPTLWKEGELCKKGHMKSQFIYILTLKIL